MSANDKLSNLTERRDELKRELSDLAVIKDQSANSALADLESALLRELERIEDQVRQIRNYIDRCAV